MMFPTVSCLSSYPVPVRTRAAMTKEIKRGRVAVFGAVIAGLTAAHEFSRLGNEVAVYEANAEAGGFYRSARQRGWHTSFKIPSRRVKCRKSSAFCRRPSM